MPLTFPAHQAFVVPLKLWRPRWFDGIALVVGSGSPDIFYAFSGSNTFNTHGAVGVAVAAVFTVVYSLLLRRYGVDGLFGSLPDFGPLQARNYRVLVNGRPRLLVTTLSAFIGAGSHVFVDSFTHDGRLAANLLGLDRVVFDVAVVGPVTGAKALQYLGHTVGSLIGVALFALVVSRKHLGDWYGWSNVEQARSAIVRDGARTRTLLVISIGLLIGFAWGLAQGVFPIFHMGFTSVIALLLAGVVNRPPNSDRNIVIGKFDASPKSSTKTGSTQRLKLSERSKVELVPMPPRRPSRPQC